MVLGTYPSLAPATWARRWRMLCLMRAIPSRSGTELPSAMHGWSSAARAPRSLSPIRCWRPTSSSSVFSTTRRHRRPLQTSGARRSTVRPSCSSRPARPVMLGTAAHGPQLTAASISTEQFAYPRAVGSPDCTCAYAGNGATFESARAVLEAFGTSKHVGEDVALANILNFSCVGILYEVALGAFVEAAAYAEAEGSSAGTVISLLPETIALLTDSIDTRFRR